MGTLVWATLPVNQDPAAQASHVLARGKPAVAMLSHSAAATLSKQPNETSGNFKL